MNQRRSINGAAGAGLRLRGTLRWPRQAPRSSAAVVVLAGLVAVPIPRAVSAVSAGTSACPMEPPQVPTGAVWSEAYFPSEDGTRLHANIYRPCSAGPNTHTPPILMVTPYLGSGQGDPARQGPFFPQYVREAADASIARGYSWITVELRGYGASAGCHDLGGPGEQQDVKASVEWAAHLPWSTGRVGMYGASYEAWTQVAALATHPRGLAATIIDAPFIDLYRTAYTNGVDHVAPEFYSAGNAAIYQYYASTPPSAFARPEQHINGDPGKALGQACNVGIEAGSAGNDPSSQFWRERNLIPAASGSRVPVLWRHGFLDDNVRPSSFLPVYGTLLGPHEGWFGQWRHVAADAPGVGQPAGTSFVSEALRWLDHYVKQESLPDPPTLIQEGSQGAWRTESQWPPTHVADAALSILPGAYRDAPGNKAQGTDLNGCSGVAVDHALNTSYQAQDARCFPQSSPGNGSWSFSPPLSAEVGLHLAGEPRVQVEVTTLVPDAHLVALLYDLDSSNTATLIGRGAHLIRQSGSSTLDFTLYPQDYAVAPGHRLGLLLTGSDDWYFDPGRSQTSVDVGGGVLSLPRATGVSPTIAGSTAGDLMHIPFAVGPGTVGARTSAWSDRGGEGGGD